MKNHPGEKSFDNRRPGQILTADQINQIVKAIFKQITGDNKTIQVKTFGDQIIISQIPPKTNPITSVKMIIEEIKNTYLICTYGSDSVSVAKPWGLRKDVDWPSEDGAITYVYTNATRRTASKAEEDDEEQYLTPPYEVDEEIFATRVGYTGIDNDNGDPIRWEDDNAGGRCWATREILEAYLPLSGGTMAGDIAMAGHVISGAVISGGTP